MFFIVFVLVFLIVLVFVFLSLYVCQAFSLAPGENMGGSSKETVSTRASVFARIRPHAEKGGHAARKAGEHPKNVDVKKLGKYDSEGIVMHGGTGEKHFDYMERVILPPEDQVCLI